MLINIYFYNFALGILWKTSLKWISNQISTSYNELYLFNSCLKIFFISVTFCWRVVTLESLVISNDGSYSYHESSLDFPWICIWWWRWSLKILIIWKRRNVLKCNLPTQLISSCLCTSHAMRVKSTRGCCYIMFMHDVAMMEVVHYVWTPWPV